MVLDKGVTPPLTLAQAHARWVQAKKAWKKGVPARLRRREPYQSLIREMREAEAALIAVPQEPQPQPLLRLWNEGRDEDGDFIIRLHADVDGEQWRFIGHGQTLSEALACIGGTMAAAGEPHPKVPSAPQEPTPQVKHGPFTNCKACGFPIDGAGFCAIGCKGGDVELVPCTCTQCVASAPGIVTIEKYLADTAKLNEDKRLLGQRVKALEASAPPQGWQPKERAAFIAGFNARPCEGAAVGWVFDERAHKMPGESHVNAENAYKAYRALPAPPVSDREETK